MKAAWFAALLLAAPALAADVRVLDAWVEEGPPTAKMLAAYMTLENLGPAQSLVAASSPQCERIEIHRTEIVGSSYRMTALKKLDLPAGARVTLKPGALHLMLVRPAKPLRAGDRVPLTLSFGDGARQELTVPVRRDPALQ